MEDKLLIQEQVKIVSSKLNIPYTTVKSILDAYLDLLIDEILLGMEVRLGYVLRIEPKALKSVYLATTGYEAHVISENLSIPYNTVLNVLTTYLDMIVDALRNNKTFYVVGLVTIKSTVNEETGATTVNALISRTVTEMLRSRDMSVRVKLNINLRDIIKTGVSV